MRIARHLFLGVSVLFCFPAIAGAATLTPNTTADDFGSDTSHCSLREAVQSIDTAANFGGCTANVTPDGYGTNDTVSLGSGTYTLTISAAGNEDGNLEGDLDIFKTMTIAGSGSPTIQQQVADERVIDETATGKILALSGLTITGGHATAGAKGAGIHFDGGAGPSSLSLDRVTVTDNNNDASSVGAAGGGIYTDSATTITNSTISDNTIGLNSGTGNGGGIYQDAGSSGTLTGVTLTVQNSSITGNSAGAGSGLGSGGGIYRITKATDNTSSSRIQNTEISGNTARNFGGGIYSQSDGPLDVQGSLVSANHALNQRGGGIAADSQTIAAGHLNLSNSTVTGNSSNADGGGIQAGGITGAINVSLLFSALAQNSGGPGTEIQISGNSGPKPQLTIEGNLIAATNPASMHACSDDGTNFMTTVDNGYNVSTDPTDAAASAPPGGENGCGIAAPLQPGDRTSVSGPAVNPLADNGGSTMTMQPTAASLAIDNMPNSVCIALNPAVTTDQRGYPRPDSAGGNCDSGAYEAFPCNGSVLNVTGPFPGCAPPQVGGGGGAGGGGAANPQPSASAPKKCKKKKHRRSATAAKKCKKKK
jgi:CSLREA domain-containing protein